jgi:hypothetical protein
MAQITQKLDLANLYINPDYYNTDYNFYNYHKFKQTGTINIIYKTPSIFLNGLYFELPYCRILNISKPVGSASFTLSLLINKEDVLDHSVNKLTISQLLTRIDTYNKQFFSIHAKKLEIRQSQTNKNNRHYISGTVGIGLQSHASGTPVPRNSRPFVNAVRNAPLEVGLELSVCGNRPVYESAILHEYRHNRFINPLLKKYTYQSFIIENISNPAVESANLCVMNVEIKHIYLYKICELIKANQLLTDTVDDNIAGFCNTVLDFINQEFFDFRANTIALNLAQDNIDLNIKFWIKANSFEKTRSNIVMHWKVCGYQI